MVILFWLIYKSIRSIKHCLDVSYENFQDLTDEDYDKGILHSVVRYQAKRADEGWIRAQRPGRTT
jgi:hypothetical protein